MWKLSTFRSITKLLIEVKNFMMSHTLILTKTRFSQIFLKVNLPIILKEASRSEFKLKAT